MFINKTEIYKLKANDNISWYNICSGNILKDVTKDEQSETSLNGTVYDFSVLLEVVILLMTYLIKYVFQIKQKI